MIWTDIVYYWKRNLPFFFTRVYSPLAQTDYCFLADKGDNKQHIVLPLHLTPPPSVHPSIQHVFLQHIPPPGFFSNMPTLCHSNNQQSRPGLYVYVWHICISASVCTLSVGDALRVCMDMHAVQASPVTVPCHKTENINMLSLQQGASHQGNNSARRTLSQPKHIVWNATAKQVVENTAVVNTKLKGEFTLTVLWVI